MGSKPVIVTVDDEPAVLRAVASDLRRKYGSEYRVMPAPSGDKALEVLQQLTTRNEAVALLLADQRMPGMTGVEFLEHAIKLYPNAKRALLTAYADTDAAIRAINTARIDYYLMKPWEPPETQLYPMLSELLDDWQASYRPPFDGVRVVGHRWSRHDHQIKDFLARNQVPYQWLDIEMEDAATRLLEAARIPAANLPVVFFVDGSYLARPTLTEIAARVGLRTRAEMPFYDLIVVGGGPAGLAAAVYGASEGLKTLLVEREAPGGQAGMSSRIENYLGFPSGLSGWELARRARDQALRFGVEILTPQEVTSLRVQDLYRVVTLSDGSEVACHALLIATGVSYRKLNIPGAEELTGAGVYYGAAITEAMSCKGQEVYVVGGGNSAGQAAMYLSNFASMVHILIRRDSLAATMSQYLIDRIHETPNIKLHPCTRPVALTGENNLETITLESIEVGERFTVPAFALFIFIGAEPHTEWVAGVLECDRHGFILSGPDLMRDGQRPKGWNVDRDPFMLETSLPGVFVAGDVRHRSVKRVASAVGEGAMAVQFIHQHLAHV